MYNILWLTNQTSVIHHESSVYDLFTLGSTRHSKYQILIFLDNTCIECTFCLQVVFTFAIAVCRLVAI